MVKLPYKLVNGIMLIPVTADGQGYFAFDTGAMQTAVNKAHFPDMQGEQIEVAKFSEEVRKSVARKGVLNALRFSDMEYNGISVLIMDLMYVENVLKSIMPDVKLLGTLGIDVIGKHNVLLDYSSAEIILDPECGFENQLSIPMRYDKLPIIAVEINGQTYDFVLDTGANTCLLGHSFLNLPQLMPVADAPNIVTIPHLKLGDNAYADITAVISDISAIQSKVPVEGVIGYQVLSAQRSILDFKHDQLLMEVTKSM